MLIGEQRTEDLNFFWRLLAAGLSIAGGNARIADDYEAADHQTSSCEQAGEVVLTAVDICKYLDKVV